MVVVLDYQLDLVVGRFSIGSVPFHHEVRKRLAVIRLISESAQSVPKGAGLAAIEGCKVGKDFLFFRVEPDGSRGPLAT